MTGPAAFARPLLALLFLLAACAGPELRAGVYEGDDTRYRLDPPGAPFQALTVDDRGDAAWADDARGALIHVAHDCSPDLDIPLEALARHLMIGFTEREEVTPEARERLAGREALRVHVRAALDGVARELMMVIVKRDGCVYDFALIAPPGAPFESSRPAFESVVQSFDPGARP